ncbi:MAG: potassium transporter Trk [Streptococcus sp.]|uniref:potassium transporter Trk n=1 Tax=Streptococcus sp. TaxID=1306 RepID=UPI00258E74D5|nr:potassium transporter Trk [Streptococcus sp.]MCR5053030.1 potassium transporter Trk [Streptococcus sp.]
MMEMLRIILFIFAPVITYHLCLLLLPSVIDWLYIIYNILLTISLWFAAYFIGEIKKDDI